MKSSLAASSFLAVLLFGAACGPADRSGPETPTEGQLKKGVLMWLESRPVITYEEVNGRYMFQGDMSLPKSMVRPVDSEDSDWATVDQPLLTTSTVRKWPNAVVPYVIDSGLSTTVRDRITQAISEWKTKT